MSTIAGPEVDARFAEHVRSRTPLRLSHGLSRHPLLGTDAVAELAGALGPDSISAEGGTKPVLTATPDFHELTAEVIVERIRTLVAQDSWFTLLNIEQSPAYRTLVDHILDRLARSSGQPPAGLRRRMGFVFASSPGSVTPAHFDIEHSVLMQLQGRRTLSFGSFTSAGHQEREVHRYWQGGSFGRLAQMPEPVSEIALEPGVGAYIPPYTPHWLTNGDDTSLSLTVTFFNRSNQDESAVQVLNERLRGWGLRPAAYGVSPRRDRAKGLLMRAVAATRGGQARRSRSR